MLKSHFLIGHGEMRGEGKADLSVGRERLIAAGAMSVCKVTVLCWMQRHPFCLQWYIFIRLINYLEKIQTRCFVV